MGIYELFTPLAMECHVKIPVIKEDEYRVVETLQEDFERFLIF